MRPAQAFIQAVFGVVLIPQLGTVPAIVVVGGEGYRRKARIEVRVVGGSSQGRSPVLASGNPSYVVLRMSQAVRAQSNGVHERRGDGLAVIQTKDISVVLITVIILAACEWIRQGSAPVIRVGGVGIVGVVVIRTAPGPGEREAVLIGEVLIELEEKGVVDKGLCASSRLLVIVHDAAE